MFEKLCRTCAMITSGKSWLSFENIGAVCAVTCSSTIFGVVIAETITGTMILCCYGFNKIFLQQPAENNSLNIMSTESGVVYLNSPLNRWPEHLCRRINTTFMYLGGSIVFTVGAGVLALQSAWFVGLRDMKSLWVGVSVCSLIVGSWLVCRYIPYEPYLLNKKHITWAFCCGITGSFLALLTRDGGRALVLAGLCAAVHVGAYATNAVVDTYHHSLDRMFLNWCRHPKICLGVVSVTTVSTIAAAYFTSFDNPLVVILGTTSLVEILALLSSYLYHNTQKLIARAETTPIGAPFDPINE